MTELFFSQYHRLPIHIGIINFLVGKIPFEEACRPVLFHNIRINIGIDLKIIPSLSVELKIIVAMSEFVGGLLICDGIVWLEGVEGTADGTNHEGDY